MLIEKKKLSLSIEKKQFKRSNIIEGLKGRMCSLIEGI